MKAEEGSTGREMGVQQVWEGGRRAEAKWIRGEECVMVQAYKMPQ